MLSKDELEKISSADFAKFGEAQVYKALSTSRHGLGEDEVLSRHRLFGTNKFANRKKHILIEFLIRFTNPLVITLFAVALISYYFGEKINSIIVIAMAALSMVLSFIQETRASKNAEKLAEMVKVRATVIRGGKNREVEIADLVPGDLVRLSSGEMVPADIRLVSDKDLYVNQSSLNGESFPTQKKAVADTGDTSEIYQIPNLLFMGSSVASGAGLGVVVSIGEKTEFGRLGVELVSVSSTTAFDKGIRGYIWLMIRFIIILGASIFFINAIMKGNVVEALLFSLAVAVGLAPEMLPMIVTVNLSKGAIAMSKKKVIVKKLDSIQNFGAMNVLCTDKTGTLTLDDIALVKHCNPVGIEDERVLGLAHINSFYQTGLKNVLDQAILKHEKFIRTDIKKVDEVPYDFNRKLMSVIVSVKKNVQLISKGAPEEILHRCIAYEVDGKVHLLTPRSRAEILEVFNQMSSDGFRVLGVAYKKDLKSTSYSRADEKEMIFRGFVAFLDPPKSDVEKTIGELEKLGIKLKILSGDNELVTRKVCEEVNLKIDGLLTGAQVAEMGEVELERAVVKVNIFVRLTPFQKEKIIRALQRGKNIVGFLGDGVNDAPALKVADVGISVDTAMDIAKETAGIILLEKNLGVLCSCVVEGRKTFANVLKYIKMGASSNLGNMISMTGASIFLPFLPMLPTQVLLNNFLYDISQISIPMDQVDEEDLAKPRPWNIKFIKEFMLVIGPVSSIFDFATFGLMWFFFHASPDLFRTGWFVESLATQTLVVLIIRTKKIPFIESMPSKFLLYTTLGVVALGALLPYTIIGKWFGFAPLPAIFFLFLLAFVILYLLMVQAVKNWFTKKYGYE
ncbi:MAG: magnesium-translocating P-type ATPase [Candidatus Berkelbacteria bacterium]